MFLKFKCTFLTEVILSPTSNTRQTTESLSYIPSSYFLGIVANQHTGSDFNSRFLGQELSFYDAHLLDKQGYTLRIPLDWYEEKLDKTAPIRLMHKLEASKHQDLTNQGIQLKQVRQGYFNTKEENGNYRFIDSPEGFLSLKSAYDTEKRCSKESLMYQYYSLPAGLVWGFMVEIKSDTEEKQNSLKQAIEAALVGERSIGKSRSAQYGRVKIEVDNFEATELEQAFETDERESPANKEECKEQYQTLYFASNACFFDKNGYPTANPCPKDLGLEGNASICWEKSAIRTRSYAPYNAKRKARDADRWIIEKGSVIVFKAAVCHKGSKQLEACAHLNEGFGRVLYNPSFLQKEELNKYQEPEKQKTEEEKEAERKAAWETVIELFEAKFGGEALGNPSPPLKLLSKREEMLGLDKKEQKTAQQQVFEFIENRKDELGKISSAQWGRLRTLVKAGYSTWDKGGKEMLFHKTFGLMRTDRKNALWPESLVAELKDKPKEFLHILASEMSKHIQIQAQEETTLTT